jgi:endonuclease G
MPFRYLTDDEVYEIQQAAIGANLAGERLALFAPMDPAFVGNIANVAAAIPQLSVDLHNLNRTRRLTDGTVPLLVWLRQAAALRPLEEAQKVFRKYADVVWRKTSGEPQNSETLGHVPDTNEKIILQDDMLPLGFLRGAVAACSSVVKIEVPRYLRGAPEVDAVDKPLLFAGTAWLIAPNMLMTNHHVVNAREFGEAPASAADFALQAQNSVAIFDYDSANKNSERIPVKELLDADADLDYALLRLERDLGRAPLTVCSSPITLPATKYLPVNIVQHPLGFEKKIAIRNNLIREITDREIQYFTDTVGGSSGSPVFDDAWRVVALHKASRSVTNVSFQGKDTAIVNVGVPIAAICKKLRDKRPELWNTIAPTAL